MYLYRINFIIDNGCRIDYHWGGVASLTPLSKDELYSFLVKRYYDYDTTIEVVSYELISPTNENPIILI